MNEHTTPLRIAFNDGWLIRTPVGPFQAVMGGGAEPSPVTLPHDAMRDMERRADAPSGAGSGYSPSAAWTYLKHFAVPESWLGSWIAMEIDGAASRSMVYVNGAMVSSRPNGYARFIVEIGPHLNYGATNEVRVEVRTHKDSRWYSGAGLYRGVRLIVAGGVHIAAEGVRISTPDVDDELATVEVATRVANETQLVRTVRVATALVDPDGETVGTEVSPVTVNPGDTMTLRQRIFVRTPQRWSVESPTLYTANVRMSDGELELDAQAIDFGIRTLQVDPVRGLRINGETVKLRGTCVHHDNGPLGAVSLPRAEERKMQKLKDAGFNAIRTAHNPASQALLDACDRVGMLVMNEAFDMWEHEKSEYDYAHDFTTWWERDIEAMVDGSFNHPSVIMYSIGNEIIELGKPSGAVLNRRIAEKVRACDATRPVTNGLNTFLMVDAGPIIEKAGGLNLLMGGDASNIFNGIAASPEVSAAVEEIATPLDITGYNYAEARYAMDAETHPNRVLVGSETFPTTIAANWREVMKHSHVLGDFTWTGWDYLGEAGIGGAAYDEDEGVSRSFAREFPFLTAYCGDIDITGFRRPASYYREIVFGLRTEPYIAVQRPERHDHTRITVNAWGWSDSVASWSWAGFEGKPIVVEVYADADEVELLLDGKAIGRSAVGSKRDLVVEFDTVYAPGTLVAVAYRAGAEVGRTTLTTADASVDLRMTADSDTISTDGQDLVYVELALADAAGTVPCNADAEITLTIDGPGVLAGFCSANPMTAERFDASTRTTFDGRALAIVRATGEGEIVLTASAAGHTSQSLTITAE